ncbi:PEP/pyruvate-binding domain-containing protein [Methanoculleus sp.]|uniref:PEP/pyruvate-binding domain-containing protein n=1 Tax=Methanoculleus sp. TaxID=90427 RepID=UPI001BD34EE0|nr:PEP/pyruvate-binding domain-containing protein [Methanoculleus sp.]
MDGCNGSVMFLGDRDADTGRAMGGKAASLHRMIRAGLPVPPGFVLAADFFAEWTAALQKTGAWQNLLSADEGERDTAIRQVAAACGTLAFSEHQQERLHRALERLPGGLYAVRSSAADEDLAGAASAGMYRTRLGVGEDTLESAVRDVYASRFEPRVFAYREESGLPVRDAEIAVIVQSLVESRVSGVAFSANPETNSVDEVVVNANWGLGESIVSGRATPDLFVVGHEDGILAKRRGEKQVSLFFSPEGGIEEQAGYRTAEWSLTDEEVCRVRDMVLETGSLFGHPIDVEWTFSGDACFLLQARPVTALLPLDKRLITPPGEPARLYMDVTLIEHGMQGSLTPFGSSWLDRILAYTLEELTGVAGIGSDIEEGLGQTLGGRIYLNISNLLWLEKPWMIALQFEGLDASTAEVLRNLDPGEWQNPERPGKMKRIVSSSLWRSKDLIGRAVLGFLFPGRLQRRYAERVMAFEAALEDLDATTPDLQEFCEKSGRLVVRLVKESTGATLLCSEATRLLLRRMVADEPREIRMLAELLDRAHPENVTTEMGRSMHRLAEQIDPALFSDLPDLAERIERKEMPEPFMEAWERFMKTYGCRGPREIDPAAKGYAGDRLLLLAQIKNLHPAVCGAMSPGERFLEMQRDRERAYAELYGHFRKQGRLKARYFRHLSGVLDTFGGLREDHKHYLVMVTARVRKRALEIGRRLASAGRIDTAEDVFLLAVEDVRDALENPGADPGDVVERNRPEYVRVERCRRFPALIDSRGRIRKPPAREPGPGELPGYGVSGGAARGPVKVLRYPGEKEIRPGEILVIGAADPGWTPLFIAAGGIVLEVGGLLQHGSIIAREYGKPCVVGIENATAILSDGQVVEVNGSLGTVRVDGLKKP